MHKCHYRRFFLAFLIGSLLFVGVAQAQNNQGGTNPQSFETKADGGKYLQPWQPCLNADQDQEGNKGTLQEQTHQSSKNVNVPLINQPNSQDKTKKEAGSGNNGLKSDLLKYSFKNNRGSTTKNMGQQVSTIGSLLTIPATAQSSGLGSSFLDGYLLKSLQDKGIGRKKETKEKESKDGLSRKKGTKEKESPDDLFPKRVKRGY
jgi:hypothetical protein